MQNELQAFLKLIDHQFLCTFPFWLHRVWIPLWWTHNFMDGLTCKFYRENAKSSLAGVKFSLVPIEGTSVINQRRTGKHSWHLNFNSNGFRLVAKEILQFTVCCYIRKRKPRNHSKYHISIHWLYLQCKENFSNIIWSHHVKWICIDELWELIEYS